MRHKGPIHVGKLIKEARLKRGWSQDRLAREARLIRPTITEIETGATSNPRWKTLKTLVKVLGISPDALLSA